MARPLYVPAMSPAVVRCLAKPGQTARDTLPDQKLRFLDQRVYAAILPILP